MYIDVIKGILNSDIDVQNKLDKISTVVRKVEEIENLAMQLAAEQARSHDVTKIEPTWEHRLKAINSMRKSEPEETSVLNRKDLLSCLEGAVGFLKTVILEKGAWEIKNPFRPYVQKKKPSEALRPLSMLSVAPWEIGMCVSALHDWTRVVQPEDKEALKIIDNGCNYLRKVQRSFGNGGLGDSFWIEELQPGHNDVRGNALETSISLSLWTILNLEDISDAVERGLAFLASCRNNDGGWGFKPSCESDIKSTSIIVMVLLAVLKGCKLEDSRRVDLSKLARAGMEWILKHQNPDGSWSYEYTGRDCRTSGSFYAIEAIALSKFYFETDQSADDSLFGGAHKRDALRKALDSKYWRSLRWYETSYRLMGGDRGGWGWWEHDPSSAVENTAAGLIVLLDTEWLDETSALAGQAMKWLLDARDQEYWWQVNTPLVIKAMIRMLHRPSRLRQKFKLAKEPSPEIPATCMATGM